MVIRLALRELANNKRFAIGFAANLALGLFGFILLQTFKGALEASLDQKSKLFLAADLSVSARRQLTAQEGSAMETVLNRHAGAHLRRSRVTELYSMARSANASRLADIMGVDANYPLYGRIDLQNKAPALSQSDSVWLSQDLAQQLSVLVGDTVDLGTKRFAVTGIIADDTSSTSAGFSFAPRLYVDIARLEGSGLTNRGATLTHRLLFALDPEAAGTNTEALVDELKNKIPDPGVQINSHRTASEQMGRVMGYLNDYLGLVALVAVFLAALGAGYLFRSFLVRRLHEIAVLLSLGLSPGRAQMIYVIQLAMLGTVAALFSWALGVTSFPVLLRFVSRYLPIPLSPLVGGDIFVLALVLGVGLSVLICLPVLARISSLKPNELFQERASQTIQLSKKALLRTALASIPAFLAFWALAVWQAHSFVVGSVFVTVFIMSGLAIAGVALAITAVLQTMLGRFSLPLRMALRSLSRQRLSSVSCILAMALASLLLNVLPQIRETLETELTRPDGERLPSLFMFDIQDEQIGDVTKWFEARGLKLFNVSPMIRARLATVNGTAIERVRIDPRLATREQQQELQSRNRGYNLTFRTELTPSERIVKGEWFEKPFDPATDKVPGISVESRMADRMGLKLGDRLVFDIQGVEVEGQVQSLRRIRWTSFVPNFFFAFQPGALDEAPKTWLAAVESLPADKRVSTQNELLKAFPNLSMIDVSALVDRMLTIFYQMSWALELMALLSLVASLAVLYSISRYQALSRRRDISLMKTLGASFKHLKQTVIWEFSLIGAVAGTLGAGLSMAVAYVLATVVFESQWVFAPTIPVASVIGIVVLSSLTAHFATRKALNEKPLELLQET